MIRAMRALGQLALTFGRGVRALPRASAHELVRTISRFGTGSLLIGLGVALATGALIVLETAAYTIAFGARDILGGMAGISIMREFGPLMLAMVMCGWIGASNAAELANLSMGGQLTALRGIGVRTDELFIAPRLLGTLLAVLLLALPADLFSVGGGVLAARFALHISPGLFLRSFSAYVKLHDLLEGVVKTACFGAAIGLISTRVGLGTRGGARAVGRSVAASVVHSVVTVLVLDLVITALLGERI